jgi:hypothetical protein
MLPKLLPAAKAKKRQKLVKMQACIGLSPRKPVLKSLPIEAAEKNIQSIVVPRMMMEDTETYTERMAKLRLQHDGKKEFRPNGSCKIKWHNHQHLQWICWQNCYQPAAASQKKPKKFKTLSILKRRL